MIIMEHRPGRLGWEYEATCGILGGARTLADCITSSEHATRHFLAQAGRHRVPQKDICAEVRHRVSYAPSEAWDREYTGRYVAGVVREARQGGDTARP